MSRIVTFGEIMMRLEPPGYARLVQTDSFGVVFGGAEANVALGLASLGDDAAFVTRLPAHAMGDAAVNSLRRYGVDTRHIVRGGSRVGIYFNEKGADLRGGVCIYDRAHSAISEASEADFDWDEILRGADHFHLTGITPALGRQMPDICIEACRAAHRAGAVVSFDLNYRSKLWSVDEARPVLAAICRKADVLIANAGQARDILGAGAEGDVCGSDDLCRDIAGRLCEKYGFSHVALTVRRSISAFDNRIWGLVYNAKSGECAFSRRYDVHIVDRVGGGDAFAAGYIHAAHAGMTDAGCASFATAAEALKHSIEGDAALVNAAEVSALAFGGASGEVKR